MNVVTKTKPKLEVIRTSRLLGYVREPDAFFAEEKRRIWEKLGSLSDVRITFNRILVAIWTPEAGFKTQGGIELLKPDQTKDENKWQGVSALVVKMGPHCYEANDKVDFLPDDRCNVDDWVMFRKGDGTRVEVWGHECIMLESEHAVRAVLDRPDSVY